jgi:hypothetical protein
MSNRRNNNANDSSGDGNDMAASRSNPLSGCWTALRTWCAGGGAKSDYLEHDQNLAQRMFWCGCFCLPWLWFVNVLYYRVRVYGKIPHWDTDYIHDGSKTSSNDSNNNSNGAASQQVEITDNNNSAGNGNAVPNDDDDDDDEEFTDPSVEAELAKWVKRSTAGCVTVTTLFISWNILFQLNRSSFSEGWLVMSEDELEVSGW